jgi:hypothetical protein
VARRIRFTTLLAALVLTRSAGASEPLDVSWDAPLGCPSREEVIAEATALVKGEPRARVEATVEEGPPFRARIVVERDGERGERNLEAPTCEALAHAAAIVIAFAMDRPSQRPPERAAVDGVRRPEQDRLQPPLRSTTPVHAGLAAGAMAEGGILPSVSPGLRVAAHLAIEHVELGLSFAWLARSTMAVADSASASFSALGGAARGAYLIPVAERFQLAPLGGVELMAVTGEGRVGETTRSATNFLVMTFAGLEARLAITRAVSAFVGWDLGLTLNRRSPFIFAGASTAHEASVVRWHGGAGARVDLF